MSDKEDQMAIEVDPEKGASQPLTGGDGSSKVTFTASSAGGGGDKEGNVEFSGRNIAQGLTKEELMKYATDPTWMKVRSTIFGLYWLVWLAMLGASIFIIATAKKCPSP